MGRPEKPIPPDVPSAVRELALRLREVRATSGLTFSELAARGHATPATLSRVTSGRSVPSWQAVSTFADAVQMDEASRAELKELWERARTETTAAKSTAAREDAPVQSVPESMGPSAHTLHTLRDRHRDFDRSSTLRSLYEAAGRPSLRRLAMESGHPRSTVHRAIQGHSLAGAADIAEALIPYLPRERRFSWTAKVNFLFGSSLPAPAPVPPLFQVKAGAAVPQAEQAVAEFRRALRQLRNLAVHGDVELSPQLAIQVMQLYSILEEAASTGSTAADTGNSPPREWTPTTDWLDAIEDGPHPKDPDTGDLGQIPAQLEGLSAEMTRTSGTSTGEWE